MMKMDDGGYGIDERFYNNNKLSDSGQFGLKVDRFGLVNSRASKLELRNKG